MSSTNLTNSRFSNFEANLILYESILLIPSRFFENIYEYFVEDLVKAGVSREEAEATALERVDQGFFRFPTTTPEATSLPEEITPLDFSGGTESIFYGEGGFDQSLDNLLTGMVIISQGLEERGEKLLYWDVCKDRQVLYTHVDYNIDHRGGWFFLLFGKEGDKIENYPMISVNLSPVRMENDRVIFQTTEETISVGADGTVSRPPL